MFGVCLEFVWSSFGVFVGVVLELFGVFLESESSAGLELEFFWSFFRVWG